MSEIQAKRLAEKRREDRIAKADLVARGLCRQCGKKRGKSPSTSRCLRCVRKANDYERTKRRGKAHRPGKPGRPPLHPRRGMGAQVTTLEQAYQQRMKETHADPA